jgi:hypothetical protein
MIRSIWITLALLLSLVMTAPSWAQQRKYSPVGFCTSSSLSSAIGLSSFSGTACANQSSNVLGSYIYAVICAYTAGIVYRDDGVAPTATAGTGGQGVAAGSCMPYNGNMGALQIIQQTAGAIVGVSIYQ